MFLFFLRVVIRTRRPPSRTVTATLSTMQHQGRETKIMDAKQPVEGPGVSSNDDYLPGSKSLNTQSRLCCTCRQAPARPRQWDCPKCHREAVRRSRHRYRHEVTRLRQLVDDLTIRNRDTMREFERKIGKSRRVILFEKTCERIECSAEVVGFLPGRILSVITESGQVKNVPLDLVVRDRPYVPTTEESEDAGSRT